MKKLTALVLAIILIFSLTFVIVTAVDDPDPNNIPAPVNKQMLISPDDPDPNFWHPPTEYA